MIKLYSYYRSTTSYRVRIALNLKGCEYKIIPVNLLHDGGEQYQTGYYQLNPQCLVPTLTIEGRHLTQSQAIIEFLDERYPQPPLLPSCPFARAQVRTLAQIIACEIHPLNNLRVLNYLSKTLKIVDKQKQTWYQHWVMKGFAAFEEILQRSSTVGVCCYGDTPGYADIFLVSQIYNAERFNISLKPYSIMSRIHEHCMHLDTFKRAHPNNQVDAV